MADVFMGFVMGAGAMSLVGSFLMSLGEQRRVARLLEGIANLKILSDRTQKRGCLLAEHDDWNTENDGEDLDID